LPQYLPVRHAGEEVFDADAQALVRGKLCRVLLGRQCRPASSGSRRHVADGSVCGGLADTEDGRQRAFSKVGAQRGECDQYSVAVGES
jgi:hypothetical protein